jgi:hypothetical protein
LYVRGYGKHITGGYQHTSRALPELSLEADQPAEHEGGGEADRGAGREVRLMF